MPNPPPARRVAQAKRPPRERDRETGRARFTLANLVALLALLILPALALVRVSAWIDWRIPAGYLAFMALLTSLVYRSDKIRAGEGERRTPENTLHLLEALGGWPAAFVAQRIVRHKIAKRNYQIAFWAIIIIHQYAAWDYLGDWPIARRLFNEVAGRMVEKS